MAHSVSVLIFTLFVQRLHCLHEQRKPLISHFHRFFLHDNVSYSKLVFEHALTKA